MNIFVKPKNTLLLLIFVLLMFVMSMSHTIAIRYGLFFLLLAMLIFYSKNHFGDFQGLWRGSRVKTPLLILLGTTIYIALHAVFISHETPWALHHFTGHWVVPMLYFLAGGLLVITITDSDGFSVRLGLTLLFYTLFAQILYLDCVTLLKLIETGHMISRHGAFMVTVANTSYLTNILMAMLLAEVVYRLRAHKRVLMFGHAWLSLFFILTLISSMEEGLRLGSGVLMMLGVISTALYGYQKKAGGKLKAVLFSGLILVLVSSPVIYNLLTDARWKSFLETVPLALNLKANHNWLDNHQVSPRLTDGHSVGESNYKRVAWIKEGVNLIIENPWGIGFGRDAFGHALRIKYPHSGISSGAHSHSSMIDYTIGVGILGFMLWLAFIAAVIRFALLAYKERANYYSIFLILVTSDFFMRSFVDGNMRDHMFQQVMMLIGIGVLTVHQLSKK